MSSKLWGTLFLVMTAACVLLFVISPGLGWWWPEPISTYGKAMDDYFIAILWLTGILFVLTEGLLGWFMLKYTCARPGRADNTSHSTKLEASWTTLTTILIIIVAVPQIGIWERIKVPEKMPVQETYAEVTGRQFEWRIRYPGPDKKLRTPDDLIVVNEFHFPVNEFVRIDLRSDDVLHSFFLPNLRIKQDAVPGAVIPVWFNATKTGIYDLVCAELCGWGHYKMRGRVHIESEAEVNAWVQARWEEQELAR